MALNYNTGSFVEIAEDLKNQINSNKLERSQIDNYLRSKYDVTADEYYDAADEALEAEEKYFKMKEEYADSPYSLFGVLEVSPLSVPAHLRDREVSALRSFISDPTRSLRSGIGSLASGVVELGEMVLPEKVTETIGDVADKVDDSLSDNKVYRALQRAFDPQVNLGEEIVGELAGIFTAGGAITKTITRAAPALAKRELKTLGGAIPTVAGFTAADIIVTDKNENLANMILEVFPGGEGIVYDLLDKIAINPDDADSVKLFKKAIEGTALGGLTELAIIGAAPLIRKVMAKRKAVREDGVLQPPKDDTNKITETEVVERPDGSYQQKVNFKQPIKVLTPEYAKESKNILKRWFTSRQGLDEQSFLAAERLDNSLRAASVNAEEYGKNFINVLEKEFGKKLNQIDKEDIELVNDALGRIDPIDETAPQQVLKILKKKTKPTKKEKDIVEAYQRKVLNKARERQDSAITQLPVNVANEITKIRTVIDDYSKDIIDRGLTGGKETTAAVDNKIGLYVTTDYEVFTNPQWVKRIQNAHKGKVDDVEALEIIDGIRGYHIKRNPKESERGIDELVQKTVDAYSEGEEAFINSLFPKVQSGGHVLGKIMTGQKYIPSDIRKLLRQVENPTSRAMSTIEKQGKLIAEHQFLKEMRDIALSDYGSKLFRTGSKFKGKGGVPTEAGEQTFTGELSDIANDYIKTLGPDANPLAGIMTTKSYKDKLNKGLDFTTPDGSIAANVFRTTNAVNAWFSGAQTVLSESTHALNIGGNMIMTLANGNYMPLVGGLKEMLTYNPTMNRLVNKVGGKIKIDPEEYANLQKKGLVNSGVNQEFFYRSLEDADFDKLLYNKNKLVKGGAKLIDGIAKVYRAEDDIFKVYNYYKELDRYTKVFSKQLANKSMTKADIEEYAAQIVKDTLPTYSRVPRFLKATRQTGVIGAFPSFTAESLRVFKNNFLIGSKDFLRGIADKNPALIAAGVNRLGAATTVGVLGTGYLISDNEAKGISEDDMKAVDAAVPIYEKNSTRKYNTPIFLNPKTGNIEVNFINVSRTNPQDAPLKLMKAIYQYTTSGQPLDENLIQDTLSKLGQVIDPLIRESLAAEFALNLVRGTDRYGTEKDRMDLVLKGLRDKATPKIITDIWEDTRKFNSKTGMSKTGWPARFEDSVKKYYGVVQQTVNFDKSIQTVVSNNIREVRNIESSLKKRIGELREGVVDYSDPNEINKIIDIVDEHMEKSYIAQKKLAQDLHAFKKMRYYVKGKGKDSIKIDNQSFVSKQMDDQKIMNIVRSNRLFKEPPNFREMLVRNRTQKNTIGYFTPNLYKKGTYAIFQKKDKIPLEVIQLVNNRIAEWKKESRPLLTVGKE